MTANHITEGAETIAFGPVPSRRLGRSLGINNIPPKICSYSCVYCQLGRAVSMQADRSSFYGQDMLLSDVADKARKAVQQSKCIDYATFVSDGEPTLDLDLGSEIRAVKSLELPVAVITNGSLLWQSNVRQALDGADWVSAKVDAVDESTWRRIDRPHKSLNLSTVLDGVMQFAEGFGGTLVTETMLVRDLNDSEQGVRALASFLRRLKPTVVYLAVPTRPPAEPWVYPPQEETLNRTYQIVAEHVDRVELLMGYEGDAFSLTGNVRDDLLRITAVHPMRRNAVAALLAEASASWKIVDDLLDAGLLVSSEYEGQIYYARRLRPER